MGFLKWYGIGVFGQLTDCTKVMTSHRSQLEIDLRLVCTLTLLIRRWQLRIISQFTYMIYTTYTNASTGKMEHTQQVASLGK